MTNFSFQFFYEIFTEDASRRLLYHGAKKSKMTKNSTQWGHAFKNLQTSKFVMSKLQTSRFAIFFNRVCMENYKPLRFVRGQMG